MTNKIKIGAKHDMVSKDEEIAILKAKNGTRSGTIGEGEMYHGSFTSGIGKNLWENKSIDWIAHRNIIERYFISLFEWEGNFKPDFRRELEKILFRYGKVAIFKAPDGEFFPAQFTFTREDEDYYGNPKKITIVHTNEALNGTELGEGEFVIIYNNVLKHGTLDFLNERMRQVVRALKDVDNSSLLSRPKWGLNITEDDAAIYDIENSFNSDKAFVPMGNIDFNVVGLEDLSGDDLTKTKMETYLFQRSNLLKLLGLDVNGEFAKKERQTEEEIAKNNEFDGMLIKDMFDMRIEKLEELKEFGMTISLEQKEEEVKRPEDEREDDNDKEQE